MDVLDGVHVPQGEGAVPGNCSSICIRLVREKLTIFPHAEYIVGIGGSLAFRSYSQVRGQCWGLREICKNVTALLMAHCLGFVAGSQQIVAAS